MTTENAGYVAGGDDDEIDEAPKDVRYAVPEGFEVVGSNVEGYWDPVDSGPVQFVISGVRLIDNGKEQKKSSALIIASLLEPCELIVNSPNKDDQVLQSFPKGTGFGIWSKAGMRDLANLEGAYVWMAPDGFRKMKGDDKNPMALFKIARRKDSPIKGTRLTLVEDGRKKSLTEAATAENPPWHLIVLGDDFGREKASQLLLQELNQRTGNKSAGAGAAASA